MERFHEERGRKREREIRLMKIKMEREGCRENVRETEIERERLRDPCILHTCFAGIFVLNTNPIGVSVLL